MKQYFAFQWHITDDCDQRCKHCYIFSGNEGKFIESMNWKQMHETFYNCMDFCEVYDRAPYFYITGGDPLLHPDFWRLAELMRSNGVPFTILGNPFHLNDEVCRKLKEYGCEKYQMSIDGLRETHDWFRKPGSFDETLEKISCIKRAGICHMMILPTGDVYACRRVQNSRVGSVFSDRLADLWVSSFEVYREFGRFEKCAKCELLAYCRGCPAVAAGSAGGFYSSDPQCWKEVK